MKKTTSESRGVVDKAAKTPPEGCGERTRQRRMRDRPSNYQILPRSDGGVRERGNREVIEIWIFDV